MNKLFGTDGIRGEANVDLLRPDQVLRLALSVGEHFKSYPLQQLKHKPTVVIGKDTRLSGYMLEPALVSGFISMGMDVLLLGPVPTPAVAYLTRSFRAQLGVMISASHNPAQDNGIKFFNAFGHKLSDDQESDITEIFIDDNFKFAPSKALGRAKRIEDAAGRYNEFVKSTFPRGLRLDGLRLVVDCANGAAYKLAPQVLWELGAEVITIHNKPSGLNINENCGATHVNDLIDSVKEHKAHAGIALDGDADRLIMVDEKGQKIDGDQLIALIATSWKRDDKLQGNAIVTTQMSNMALETYLQSIDVELLRANVGDRYVIEMMRAHGCNIGGEQSGHIILSEYATTGDGLISAMQVLAEMAKSPNVPLSALAYKYAPLPQKLVNVKVNAARLQDETVQQAIEVGHNHLDGVGRLFIRPSGTEPLIRIMVESAQPGLMDDVINPIAQALTRQTV